MANKLDKVETAKFIRNQEDFVCENCGFEVKGNGYTNHCPKCLWSKHVDINPGDRAAKCGGLMKMVSIEGSTENYVITHRCVICGYEKRNKMAKDDDMDVVLKLISEKRGS